MTTLLVFAFWFAPPMVAAFLHRRACAAPDRLAAWLATGTALGLMVAAALAYPRWPAPAQPPLTDTYHVVAHFHYLASTAVFFLVAALALVVIDRGFPFAPRALSLTIFGTFYAGTGITLVPRLSSLPIDPTEFAFQIPTIHWPYLAAVHLSQLAVLLLVLAMPISLWNLWRKWRAA